MKNRELELGQVVISKKGKDKGQYYIVTGFDENTGRLRISDGCKYGFGNPKMKNRFHLQSVNCILPEIRSDVGKSRDQQTRQLDFLISRLLENLSTTRR